MMEVDVLEYKVWQGNHVKVKSYHYRKGKLVSNPKYEWHKIITSNITPAVLFFKKKYKQEMKNGK